MKFPQGWLKSRGHAGFLEGVVEWEEKVEAKVVSHESSCENWSKMVRVPHKSSPESILTISATFKFEDAVMASCVFSENGKSKQNTRNELAA